MPTVLVTGANRGLGLEWVRQYGGEGWSVIACARNPGAAAELQAMVAQHPKQIDVHALDVADFGAIADLAARLADRAIDVLINNAGMMGAQSFATSGLGAGKFGASDFEEWSQVFKINAFAPMKMAEAFLPHVMRGEQKKLIAISSIVGSMSKNNVGGMYAYRSSKAALNAIMRSMGIDLARKHGVCAIPLHPGWVRTEMGGDKADIDAATSVAGMRKVVASLTTEQSGKFYMYDGSELPW
ncbi:MAG TPA: SDR family oxidoreductase [Steroidobacteraceae bacterium]|nr:SDR family oxidoreductase [Steroidobacteraceae bacterium]HRX88389.1 SDR family oxidoreductase [Steroidobacteraceae bacterium]